MKTAMQELMSQMHNLTWKLMDYEKKIEVFNIFLEKEKEQIKDAYSQGYSDGVQEPNPSDEYYEETYNQNNQL